jgi:uncharacterized membrane protein YgdD (TMEM256/DUF423 family)
VIAGGAICCALAIALGAFGAHGLASRLDPRSLALWETACRYLMYGGLGQVLAGLAALASMRRGSPLLIWAGRCLLGGTLLFSGTVAALALGAPRWLGAVTPFGGLLLIAGFGLFAGAGRTLDR